MKKNVNILWFSLVIFTLHAMDDKEPIPFATADAIAPAASTSTYNAPWDKPRTAVSTDNDQGRQEQKLKEYYWVICELIQGLKNLEGSDTIATKIERLSGMSSIPELTLWKTHRTQALTAVKYEYTSAKIHIQSLDAAKVKFISATPGEMLRNEEWGNLCESLNKHKTKLKITIETKIALKAFDEEKMFLLRMATHPQFFKKP